ncbi:hypothetical protein [Xenorhabdus lircayensis]|uniref:hypothetical protein n=1 Tax=Xenorhabdus lircayensis TaxID=2763499 RepID=UPI002FCAC674
MDSEKAYYADGEACNIPEGCRLDVRVQMPEDSVWNLREKEMNEAYGRHKNSGETIGDY